MKSTFNTLSRAAADQLTQSRAGLLLAGFDGLNGDQLRSIAEQDNDAAQAPSRLAVEVSRFLSSERRNHVVGVGFLSRGALHPKINGSVDSGGVTYHFPNPPSEFWSEDFRGMFPGGN